MVHSDVPSVGVLIRTEFQKNRNTKRTKKNCLVHNLYHHIPHGIIPVLTDIGPILGVLSVLHTLPCSIYL